MDQNSEFWMTAKEVLKQNNKTPYSDQEIKEIVKLLDSMAEVFCQNLK